MNFLQGIAGTLELFHRSTLDFQKVGRRGHRSSGRRVPAHRPGRATSCRSTSGSWRTPTPCWCSAWTISSSEQEASPEEIAAIREWLKREDTCLLIAPHHDVGFTADMQQRQMEYKHHGDELVPRQQRFGQYTRSLMKALDVPVHESVRAAAGRGQGHQADRAAHASTRTWTSWGCSMGSRPSISTCICRTMR